jgi:hypothetical protein
MLCVPAIGCFTGCQTLDSFRGPLELLRPEGLPRPGEPTLGRFRDRLRLGSPANGNREETGDKDANSCETCRRASRHVRYPRTHRITRLTEGEE